MKLFIKRASIWIMLIILLCGIISMLNITLELKSYVIGIIVGVIVYVTHDLIDKMCRGV